jgi:hypothetical protein
LKRPIETEKVRVRRPVFILFTWLLVFGGGCRTATPLPPADFSAPGWHVQQGQAVWKFSPGSPELTGDLLLATNVNGNFFIQFSKTPFPLATAQVAGDEWRIELGADKYSRQGRGPAPNRFAWFELPRALLEPNPGGDWQFVRLETNSWRLKNSHTGETLEGGFFP